MGIVRATCPADLRLIKALRTSTPKPLTKRQLEYVRCACHRIEPTREAIAAQMGCAPKTVENFRADIYLKWKVSTRMEFLYRAVAEGLVPCPCGGAEAWHRNQDPNAQLGWSGV